MVQKATVLAAGLTGDRQKPRHGNLSEEEAVVRTDVEVVVVAVVAVVVVAVQIGIPT